MTTLEDGREINERIHELLGWRHLTGLDVPEPAHHLREAITIARQEVWMRDGHWQCVNCGDGPRDYSEDIDAAFEVIEHFGPERWSVDMVRFKRGDRYVWSVMFCEVDDLGRRTGDGERGEADEAPLAICRAALQAVDAANPPSAPAD